MSTTGPLLSQVPPEQRASLARAPEVRCAGCGVRAPDDEVLRSDLCGGYGGWVISPNMSGWMLMFFPTESNGFPKPTSTEFQRLCPKCGEHTAKHVKYLQRYGR